MSDILVLADARTRGIDLPEDADIAQDVLDETEAWLARIIGPLTGARTERFYVGLARTVGPLGLRRYTDSVVIVDGVQTLDTSRYRLVDGQYVTLVYSAPSQYWSGPYIDVTYTPSDELEVRRVLYELLSLSSLGPGALQSETIGDYSYTTGPGYTLTVTRRALATSLLPKRGQLVVLRASRPLVADDPVVNRAEPVW